MTNEIKNPYRYNIALSVLTVVGALVLVIVPFIVEPLKSYEFYFFFFAAGLVVLAIVMGIMQNRRYKRFRAFLDNGEEKTTWNYDESYYNEFLGELKAIQKKASFKKYLMMMGLVAILSLVLFFLSAPNQKYYALMFFIFFGLVITVFVLVVPNTYQLRATDKPYLSILSPSEAYFLGKHHYWEKAKAKLKEYDNGHRTFLVLTVNYETMTVNGKLFQEWNILLPDSDEKTIEQAKKLEKQINKRTKRIEAAPPKGDIIERGFEKLMDRSNQEEKK